MITFDNIRGSTVKSRIQDIRTCWIKNLQPEIWHFIDTKTLTSSCDKVVILMTQRYQYNMMF